MTQFPTDYDTYAQTYAWARRAVPWVLDPLEAVVAALPDGAAVLEIGCGTGNYIRALAERWRGVRCFGFDLSQPMLDEARKADAPVSYVRGNAAREFPYDDGTFAFVFAVDVVHHIDDVIRFFAESRRVLAGEGRLTIVTDSSETLSQRSLTKFFPELLPIELARYSDLSVLHEAAAAAGLQLESRSRVSGEIPLSDGFLRGLEAKCSSAMRLISAADHAAGMARVRAARARGESWWSYYDVLHYVRPDRAGGKRLNRRGAGSA